MKIVEVHSLLSGIDQTLAHLDNQEKQVKAIEAAIENIVSLEDSLKGQGGQSIRSFYQEQHLSFIAFYQQTIESYKETLKILKNELLSIEPDHNGFIRESFLQHDLKNGLNHLKINTVEMTNEANSIIDSVSDIVSLPKLQDEHFLQQISLSNQNIEQTVEKWYAFDSQQTNNLSLVEQQAERMKTYLQDMQTMFQKGSIKVDSYSKQLIEPIKSHDNIGTKKIHLEEKSIFSETELDGTVPFTGTNLVSTLSEGAAVAHTTYKASKGYKVIRNQGNVKITYCTNDSFADLIEFDVPFSHILHENDTEKYFHIPTKQQIAIQNTNEASTLADLNIQVSTGPTVDFRIKDLLRKDFEVT